MTQKLKVGLIGCGNVVVYGHRPALLALADVELVALADITPARRVIGKDWFGLRDDQLYADYRDLLNFDEIEAVAIAVPQKFRPPIVLDALAAGKHVLSEKPISNTPAAAAELVRAADAAGLKLGLVHNYHFLPEFRGIKRLLADGVIGDIRLATLHFMGVIDYPGAAEYQADWRHTLAAGGGVLLDMVHAVYLAEWLVGAPAQQVMAFVDAPEYAQRQPVIEDLALLQIAFPSAYAAIHMAWGEGVGGVDISGSDGQIRLRYKQYQSGGFNMPIELYSVDSDWNRSDHAIENLATARRQYRPLLHRALGGFRRCHPRRSPADCAGGGWGARPGDRAGRLRLSRDWPRRQPATGRVESGLSKGHRRHPRSGRLGRQQDGGGRSFRPARVRRRL